MSKTVRPRRSVLYMPGANTRALEKARSLPADALIFDLEDAVAPDAKEAARSNVVLARWLSCLSAIALACLFFFERKLRAAPES